VNPKTEMTVLCAEIVIVWLPVSKATLSLRTLQGAFCGQGEEDSVTFGRHVNVYETRPTKPSDCDGC